MCLSFPWEVVLEVGRAIGLGVLGVLVVREALSLSDFSPNDYNLRTSIS